MQKKRNFPTWERQKWCSNIAAKTYGVDSRLPLTWLIKENDTRLFSLLWPSTRLLKILCFLTPYHRYNKGAVIPQSHSDSLFYTWRVRVGEIMERKWNNSLLSFIILTKLTNAYVLDVNSASVSTTLSHTFQKEMDAFTSCLPEIWAFTVLLLQPRTLSQNQS